LTLSLAPGAELLGWDVTALGLPAADLPFATGCLTQNIEMPGVWLERGRLDAGDLRLMDSPAGMAGNRCIASLFFATGSPMERQRRELALEATRAVLARHALAATSGATCPNSSVLVVRVLAPLVEPAMELLREIRTVWRQLLWQKSPSTPRIWFM
jgi:urease accessory protein